MGLAGFEAFRFSSIEFRGSGFGFIHWVCEKVLRGWAVRFLRFRITCFGAPRLSCLRSFKSARFQHCMLVTVSLGFRVRRARFSQGFAASSFQISGFCRHPNSWGVLSVYSSAFSMSDFAPDVQSQISLDRVAYWGYTVRFSGRSLRMKC